MGFDLTLSDVANVIQDENGIPIQPGKELFQLQLISCPLQFLNKSGGLVVAYPVALFDQAVAYGSSQVGFTRAAWPEKEKILRTLNPTWIRSHRLYLPGFKVRKMAKIK